MSPDRARPAEVSHAAPIFAALGDETRLALIARLGSGRPQSIVELGRGLPLTRQAVTKHLQVLSDAGLVSDFRRGRERLWQPETKRLDEARVFLDKVAQRWDAAIERLRAFVED